MQVIAYTHSGDALSVAYGFACLFVIGFLWGALGGAGTALPAFLSRARLTELLIPIAAVIVAWIGQDVYFSVKFAALHEQVTSGTITADMITRKMIVSPLKRNLARAYPAITLMVTESSAEEIETMAELRK